MAKAIQKPNPAVVSLKILALDPAACTGWAHSSGASGTWDISVRADESNGMRLIRLQAKLEEIRVSVGVNLVVFEASRNAKFARAVKVAAQIQAAIEIWCTSHNIDYRGYSPAEIKKHATGKGTADKDKMVAAAEKKWPDVKLESNDHADALWLLDLASEQYGNVIKPEV